MALPGAGQVYNKKYWKVPLFWLLMGAAGTYAYVANAQYQDYRRAYYLLLGYQIADLSNNPFVNSVPKRFDFSPEEKENSYRKMNEAYADIQDNVYIFNISNALPEYGSLTGFYFYQGNPDSARFASRFSYLRDDALRQRDLAGLFFIFAYVLNMMDAAVDAHFSNYKLSEDISMNVQPCIKLPRGLLYIGFEASFYVTARNRKKILLY